MSADTLVPTGRIEHREIAAMGGRAHIVVHGGPSGLADAGVARLRRLEQLWSRFLADSDITRANRAEGLPVVVAAETMDVVERAVDGWRQTAGRFDVTVLPALLAEGYAHSAVNGAAAPSVGARRIGTSSMVVVDRVASTLTVPPSSAIDLGGIGKGFAADLVADELRALGSDGVLVNVSGDLAVRGTPSDDSSWYLAVEDPLAVPAHLVRLRLSEGGVATSGTTIRRWTSTSGEHRHHIIDPATSRSATTSVLTATVLAASAATAEVFATAAMLHAPEDAVAMLEAAGLAGVVVAEDGTVGRTASLERFVA